MFTHPDITAAVAAERRRDLLTRANARRLTRAAAAERRNGRTLAIAPRLVRIIRHAATRPAVTTPRTA